MAEITPAELDERLQSDDPPLVLDVRHADAFEDWHVPGSENVDVYDELRNGGEAAMDALRALPEDEEIVTVCAAGVVSRTATDVLVALGYEARTLVDGMAGWSRVHRRAPVAADIDGSLVQVARPGTGCLSYVLVSDGEAVVVDPSRYVDPYESVIDGHAAELVGVLDTHAHADHVSGGRRLADRHAVPYYLHPEDAMDVEARPVDPSRTLTVGDVAVTAIHTPGHSPGGVTFDVGGEALLTGDTLFHESVGRVELGVEAGLEETDVEENAVALHESIQRLLDRDDDPLVLPAHDPGSPDPPVTARLSEVVERNGDLDLAREDFVETLSDDVPEHPQNFERVKAVNVGLEDVPDDELADLESGPNRCAAE